MSELAGKVAIVTGAGRGIGSAVAKALAAAGAKVVVSARRAEDAETVAANITGRGAKAVAVPCNVADIEAVSRMAVSAKEYFGSVDILINNAGVIQPIGRLAETAPEAWLRAIEVNLVGAYHATRVVLPDMIARKGGVIVNLSSGAAHKPFEGWSAYCASKAGLAMLTRSIHHEYAAHGIVAIGFAPGVVDTGMQGEVRSSGLNPVSQLPRENLASAEDPARAIAWLATPAAHVYAGREIDIRDLEFRHAAGWANL